MLSAESAAGPEGGLLRSLARTRFSGFRTLDDPLVFGLGLVAVVLLQAFSALGFAQRGQVTFSSDQAVSALMALEIRDLGSHPPFYWGVSYAGSLEPHLLSLAFRILPETVASYRAVMFSLSASATVLVALATALGYGRRAGLLAGAYLAAGPSFLFYKLLSSDGAYASFFTLAAACVYLAARMCKESDERRARAVAFGLGAALGLAWWVMPLSVVLGGVVATAVAVRPRAWLRPGRILLLCAGLAMGASPWITENVRTGFASLRSKEMSGSDSQQMLSQGRVLVSRGLPVLLGGRSPGGRAGTFPGSEKISVVLYLGLAVTGGVLALRRSAPVARFLALSSVLLLLAPALLALSRARTGFQEDPRYLLATYIALAVLSGVGLARLIEGEARAGSLALASLLILLGPLSQLSSQRYGDDPRHGRIAETVALAEWLSAAGIREVYAEYWIAYRLTFLSRREVIGSPFGEGALGPIPDKRAAERVDGAKSPAFLLEPEPARKLVAFLESRAAPYSHEYLPDLGRELVYRIPAEELATLRACRCLPAVGPASPVGDKGDLRTGP